MSEHEQNNLNGIFSPAESNMGQDLYQANVNLSKAQAKHCEAEAKALAIKIEAEKLQIEANVNLIDATTKAKESGVIIRSASFGILVLSALATSPAWVVAIYRWAFNV